MLLYSWGMRLFSANLPAFPPAPLRASLPALLLALLAAVPAAAQGRLWRANLADSRDFLPGAGGNSPDTAWLAGPEPGRRWQWTSEASWLGVLDREAGSGDRASEILSGRATQTLWASPLPGTAFAVAWSGALDRNHHREPLELDARLGIRRAAYGFAWVQSVLPAWPSAPAGGPPALAAGRPFLDVAVSLPDAGGRDFAWMLAGGRLDAWRLEAGMRQEDVDEAFTVRNLDTLGGGESVAGAYRTRSRAHRLLARFPALGGSVSALGAYAYARPRRPDGEFWFCDSSRALDARLAYARRGVGGGWEAWVRFQEAEAVTLGRRIPPGSEGMKRFHFARNHAFLWELGADAAPAPGWRAGATWRRLAWESRPPADALEARSETLSYNRLGLSFIANLYGGLFKLSELIDGDLAADLWEARGAWALRRGPFGAEAGLSLFRTGFDLRAEGRTLSQRILAVDTSQSFLLSYRGYLLGVTPRIRAVLDFGALRLEAEAAQALPVHVAAERRGVSGGGAAETDPADLSAFRNAFEARARLVAGF